MPRELTVTDELIVPSSAADLWDLLIQPESQQRFEPRVRLVSKSEESGVNGSGFVLTLRGLPMQYEAVKVEPERLIEWRVKVGNRTSTQRGELLSEGGSVTRLRWSVRQQVSWPLRRFMERTCRKELKKWLESVKREASS